MDRRELIKQSSMGAVGLGLAARSAAGQTGSQNLVGSDPHEDQLDQVTRWATVAAFEFRRFPDPERQPLAGPGIVYKRAQNIDLKLDVYTPGPETQKRPTVVYIHGGGWVHIWKEDRIFYLLPYLARGMNTVNVEYRLANQSLAPAAVEDCRCALRWVHQHAQEYGFDTSKIVVLGESGGGHLALMTGMLDPSAGFDDSCAWLMGDKPIPVAAIINLFGITDVEEMLEEPHKISYAMEWLGYQPNRLELAKKLSPLSYVRKGVPPIITVVGTKDPVLYPQNSRLHEALDRAGVPNQLVTIPGGGHGHFPREENFRAQAMIYKFLEAQGILEEVSKRD